MLINWDEVCCSGDNGVNRIKAALHESADVVLFGINSDSERVVKSRLGTQIRGVFDSFSDAGKNFFGTPILSAEQIAKETIVVNSVTNSRPLTAHKWLADKKFKNIFFLADYLRFQEAEDLMPNFCREFRATIEDCHEVWDNLFDSLHDHESKLILNDLIKYRFSGDPNLMKAYKFSPQKQYFEDFCFGLEHVFVDGGGFDGSTSALFSDFSSNYKSIHLFEPDEVNFQKCKSTLVNLRDVNLYQLGLSNKSDTLFFEQGAGSGSKITPNGLVEIAAVPLDDVVPNATFIKLDLEGWELNALKGAQHTISKKAPLLAVGAYHQPKDLIEIYQYLRDLRPDYKFKIRHYTESWTETVLYASISF